MNRPHVSLLLCAFIGLSVQQTDAQVPRLYRDRVEPHWFADNTKFWYQVALPNGGREFVLVDTTTGRRSPAFDHSVVAERLSDQTSSKVVSTQLKIENLQFSDDLATVVITRRDGSWQLDLKTNELTKVGDGKRLPPRNRFFMPPRKSIDRGGDVELVITNELKSAVKLVWMGRDGAPVSYGTIAAGGKKVQHTFAGHVWLLQSEDEKPMAAFESFDGPNEIIINDETLAATKKTQPPKRRPRRDDRRNGNNQGGSPDRKFTAFVKDYNLWLSSDKGEEPRQLSDDATSENTFHKDASRARLVEMQYQLQDPPLDVADVRWSPDSQFVLAFQTKKVPERRVYYVESSPREQLQPTLQSYPYAKPGDDLPTPRPRLFATDGTEIAISTELFPNPFKLQFLRWSDDSSRFWMLYNERGHQRLRVLEVNAESGAVRTVVDEQSNTFIQYSTSGKFVLEWLGEEELLWASERSGWNHLYRYNVKTGEVINAVTKGDWNVRRIEHIDRDNGVIWFYAVGIAKDQDPYHEHFCRINLDGSDLHVLTEGDGTHKVTFSPDRRFIFDRYSRVDLPPVNELRRSDDGSLVCHLETADASEIIASRRLPERFHAVGRDGVTDIWGIVHFPLGYDPSRKYPVVENIYAGPHDHHVPKAFRSTYRHQHQIADRGMIVVQIDGMGTAWRSKTFHDMCYKNLRDAGFPDRIAWMKAASREFPAMDLSRVGIYGGSAGGQNAMGALLWHGTFYKAAVADCGCHDNRMDKLWWNEQWMGYPVDEHYTTNSNAANAYRLQGKLMLVVGELDRNVDPASTTQVVRELIKANKDFDFLLVPGAGHGACERPYGSKRRADFLAKHLAAE